ncbi:acyl-CoA thioesterase [Marinobacter adhaerens]|uniref:Acyl-CoA thioesterase n=1 Tax=Marinobacter adhaerens TaxID=1033846 RepID=A0A851HPW6_9GAMM|nr:acyl-CoA thioesterase [Marinobacter adhaerens]NWN90947.1 acyl-CoA thioesterase [Marinobacter adhaerens]
MSKSGEFRPVSESQIVLKELMVPSYENFGGKVHGGVVLSLMDKTASVDKVDFLNPVEVGEILTLYSSVNYTGKSSMEIGIRVESENFQTGVIRHTNTSYFTMVALNRDTKSPEAIPGLLLESDEEIRRFLEGRLRRKVRKLQRHELEQARSEIDYDIDERSLEGESCKIAAG